MDVPRADCAGHALDAAAGAAGGGVMATYQSDSLKPCPFCGGEGVVEGHHNRFTEWYLCSCPKCHVSQVGNGYGFKFEAIEAWNRRTYND